MATPLIGTVIITGGNGALGSEIAVAIARTQPLVHLLLTARDIKDQSVQQVSERIRMIGPRSLEIAKLDLSDFDSMTTFAKYTVQRVRHKTIPPIIVLINSAATLSYVCDAFTKDGYDPVYQVNCLSPFLLTVTLLEGFRATGSLVLNIGCSTISHGRLYHFDTNRGKTEKRISGESLSTKEGNLRFASSKLLMSAAMYALRRSLYHVSISLLISASSFFSCLHQS
jgi:mannan polymerase II complex ANP1 subunit